MSGVAERFSPAARVGVRPLPAREFGQAPDRVYVEVSVGDRAVLLRADQAEALAALLARAARCSPAALDPVELGRE